jgi:hypothetical protein
VTTPGQIIAEVAAEWAARQPNFTPDPTYANNEPSQYAETDVFLSAPVAAQNSFDAEVDRRLEAAGFRARF